LAMTYIVSALISNILLPSGSTFGYFGVDEDKQYTIR